MSWSKEQSQILKRLDLSFWPNLEKKNKTPLSTSEITPHPELIKSDLSSNIVKNKPKPISQLTKSLTKELSNQIDANLNEEQSCCLICNQRIEKLLQTSDTISTVIITDPTLEEEPFGDSEMILFENILSSLHLSQKEIAFLPIGHLEKKGLAISKEQLSYCNHKISEYIQKTTPHLIIISGQIAAQTFLQTKQCLGEILDQNDIAPEKPILILPEMSYLLEMPAEKRQVWQTIKRYLQIKS